MTTPKPQRSAEEIAWDVVEAAWNKARGKDFEYDEVLRAYIADAIEIDRESRATSPTDEEIGKHFTEWEKEAERQGVRSANLPQAFEAGYRAALLNAAQSPSAVVWPSEKATGRWLFRRASNYGHANPQWQMILDALIDYEEFLRSQVRTVSVDELRAVRSLMKQAAYLHRPEQRTVADEALSAFDRILARAEGKE